MWEQEFHDRIAQIQPTSADGYGISIKLRVTGGCFHREHSPYAFSEIDEYLSGHSLDGGRLEEHETGPEILLWVASGVALGTAIIGLVTAIINYKSAGTKHGDRLTSTELIVRGFNKDGQLVQETVMKLGETSIVTSEAVEKALTKAIQKLPEQKPEEPETKPAPKSKKAKGKGKK